MRRIPCCLLFVTLAAALAACDAGTGDLWDGDPQELVGVWRARDRDMGGQPYLSLEASRVFRYVVATDTQASEVDRGSWVVEDGSLVRLTTRHLDPTRVGQEQANGIYRVSGSELVLEPAEPGGDRIFFTRTAEVPEYRPLQ